MRRRDRPADQPGALVGGRDRRRPVPGRALDLLLAAASVEDPGNIDLDTIDVEVHGSKKRKTFTRSREATGDARKGRAADRSAAPATREGSHLHPAFASGKRT